MCVHVCVTEHSDGADTKIGVVKIGQKSRSQGQKRNFYAIVQREFPMACKTVMSYVVTLQDDVMTSHDVTR